MWPFLLVYGVGFAPYQLSVGQAADTYQPKDPFLISASSHTVAPIAEPASQTTDDGVEGALPVVRELIGDSTTLEGDITQGPATQKVRNNWIWRAAGNSSRKKNNICNM